MTTTRIEIKGPLLTGKPGAIVLKYGAMAVRELVEMGEQRLSKLLRPRPGGVYLSAAQAGKGKASTGNYRRHLTAVSHELQGLLTDGGVLYGPWLEGTGSRNASTRFKGYFSFRKTAQYLRQQAPKVARRHVTGLVRALGGK